MSETHLLVVDMQRVFADPASPWAVPGFGTALAAAARLLDRYPGRATLTRFVPDAEPAGAWADYEAAYPFTRDAGSQGSWELVPELADRGLPVHDAPTMSKWTPEVAAALGPPDTLLLAGVATECCVLATALAAGDAGVRVRLVADACAGGTPQDHERALAITAAFAPLVQVVRSSDLLA